MEKSPPSFKTILISISLATILLSGLLGLAISEIIIRRLYPQNTYQVAKISLLQVFKKSDLIPFELKPSSKSYHIAPTHEFSNDIATNSLGYRGPEFSVTKPGGTFRILMLGDSTTFGIGANDDQTFSVKLQQLLRDQGQTVEVINAGFASGLSPDTYYLYLKDKGLKLQPDLVFVNLFLGNDLTDLFENDWPKVDDQSLPTKINSLERQIDRQGRLVFRQMDWKYRLPIVRDMHVGILALNIIEQKLPRVETIIRWLVNAPDLLDDISETEKVSCVYLNQCSQRFETQWQRLDKILAGFSSLSSVSGKPIVITLMPAAFQLTAHKEGIEVDNKIDIVIPEEGDNQNYPQKRIIATLNNLNLDYLDLLKSMRAGSNPEYSNGYVYKDDGHFTPVGNTVIAQSYLEYLLDSHRIPGFSMGGEQ